MLKQLWTAGIIIAFSVFAIKTGLGICTNIFDNEKKVFKRILFIASIFLIYFLLFIIFYLIILNFNLEAYLDIIIKTMKYGMILHILVALGLFAWGISLLIKKRVFHSDSSKTKAVIFLVFPCPVCATVIFLNLSLTGSLFETSLFFITLLLFAVFSGITTITVLAMFPFRKKIEDRNSFLGLIMCAVAVYFFLTILIAPIYQEIKATYAMALSNNPINMTDGKNTFIFLTIVIGLASVGCLKKIKRS